MSIRYSAPRLGLIARMDDSGLGNQTHNLCKMLHPGKILLIDSKSFNRNIQHPEWYEGFDVQVADGFPSNTEVWKFLQGLTHIITAETFYSHYMVELANRNKIKTFAQYNWEFLEQLMNPKLPTPYKWLAPSHWKVEEMEAKYKRISYLPPPIFLNEFKRSREINFARKEGRRFVHIIGTSASFDRNGTRDILEALKYSTANYELVIRSQYPVPEYENETSDSRIIFEIGNIPEQQDMYKNFDAMIMPRRYGGLCLPMNEALASGLPVIMSNISPNNKVLPPEWLIDSKLFRQFMARTTIDVFQTDVKELGEKIDWLATMEQSDLNNLKVEAFDIAFREYSADELITKYRKEMEYNV